MAELKAQNILNSNTPSQLEAELQDMACDNFSDLKKIDKAKPYCDAAEALNPYSIPAVLAKASRLIKAEEYEEAINLLKDFKDSPDAQEGSQDQRIHAKIKDVVHRFFLRASRAFLRSFS